MRQLLICYSVSHGLNKRKQGCQRKSLVLCTECNLVKLMLTNKLSSIEPVSYITDRAQTTIDCGIMLILWCINVFFYLIKKTTNCGFMLIIMLHDIWCFSGKLHVCILNNYNCFPAEPAKIPKKIVDVGCGIGGSSRYLARKYGAKCQGITLSPVQAQRAQALAAAQGLADKVCSILVFMCLLSWFSCLREEWDLAK